VHESLNMAADDCSPSLTFQFGDPVSAVYWRNYMSRLRRMGDFNECWHRVDSLATFSPLRSVKETAKRLKRLGTQSVKDLIKHVEDVFEAHVADSAEHAWAQVLAELDTNKDGKVSSEDWTKGGEAPLWLRSSIDFYDVDGDGLVVEAEFHTIFAHWLGTEASVLREKKSKPKKLQRLEL